MKNTIAPGQATNAPKRDQNAAEILCGVAAACRAATNGEPDFNTALEVIHRALSFEVATLFLYDREARRFVRTAGTDESLNLMRFVTEAEDSGLPQWTTVDNSPVLLTDGVPEGITDGQPEFRSIISAPLLSGGGVVGVLNIGCREAARYDAADVALMTAAADVMAMAEAVSLAGKNSAGQATIDATEVVQQNPCSESSQRTAERLDTAADLAATVHHQVNNPLAVIVGNIQCLLLEQRGLPESAQKRLKVIEKAAMKISEVNRKLLNINRLVHDSFMEEGSAETPTGVA